MRAVVLDTETTGLDPKAGHRLVEIGCVEVHHGVPTGEIYHVYLNPERSMPQEAFNIHGLSEEFLADKPLFKDVADDFLTFIGEDPLIIHNARFDMKFLNAELDTLGKALIPFERAVDTLMIAKQKFPGSPVNLDALCKRFQVDNSGRLKHGALLDAELLAEVYVELMGGRQTSISLGSASKTTADAPLAIRISRTPRAERFFPASPEEVERHTTFLEKVKEPLWGKDKSA
ncbi:MAG: DNA polymerase III subunit epsilon [Alphaproteobacteria bacterium]|nr:DNA polymerase III subunit epsilon [Alphaproteobacteria bacterium]